MFFANKKFFIINKNQRFFVNILIINKYFAHY